MNLYQRQLLRLLSLEVELLRLKHGKHNQATHGRKGRAGKAGGAAYAAARAGGASHQEALQAGTAATAAERQTIRTENAARRTERLQTQAARARAAANGTMVTLAQRAVLLQKADRLEARARGEKVGPKTKPNATIPVSTAMPAHSERASTKQADYGRSLADDMRGDAARGRRYAESVKGTSDAIDIPHVMQRSQLVQDMADHIFENIGLMRPQDASLMITQMRNGPGSVARVLYTAKPERRAAMGISEQWFQTNKDALARLSRYGIGVP